MPLKFALLRLKDLRLFADKTFRQSLDHPLMGKGKELGKQCTHREERKKFPQIRWFIG